MSGLEFSDRYSATGTPRPDPATVCKGQCEGMGFYPTDDPAEWPPDAKPDDIGYVMVDCPDCGGTGRRDGKGAPVTPADRDQKADQVRRAIGGEQQRKSDT